MIIKASAPFCSAAWHRDAPAYLVDHDASHMVALGLGEFKDLAAQRHPNAMDASLDVKLYQSAETFFVDPACFVEWGNQNWVYPAHCVSLHSVVLSFQIWETCSSCGMHDRYHGNISTLH
jgi:hypothetical protein